MILSETVSFSSEMFAACGFFLLTVFSCKQSRKYRSQQQRQIGKNGGHGKTKTCQYDVIIVGAGPAGSTAAYFLAKGGLKVAILDKKVFPRAKPCGDAWCAPALTILEEMGVLEKMEKDGIVKSVTRGGLISPFGHECINTDGETYGSVTGCRTYAIKRQIADEYLVKAAAALPTVCMQQGMEVVDAKFDSSRSIWTIDVKSTLDSSNSALTATATVTAVMLIVCDGSTSYLGQRLGIVPKGSQPDAVCSHAYVKGGTHNWHSADGVMIFNRAVLPGYSALFRHYNDDMYLGTYILPGGRATSRTIAPFETDAIAMHPYIRDAFGEEFQWEEKRVVAPIRTGGVPRSYGNQLLLVGDAAGHVDPLTGEGIHTAMIAAKIAAQAVTEMFLTSDFSAEACRAYELRCYDSFGKDFQISAVLARVLVLLPEVLDAVAVVGSRRGQAFLDFFGEVMTGVRPKTAFLQPALLLDLALETVAQILLQRVFCVSPLVPSDIGKGA
eukprot:gene12137-25471_t